MTYAYRRLLAIIICSISVIVKTYAQPLKKPKRIKADGEYIHLKTNIKFPTYFGDFYRTDIHSFDKENQNIACGYELREKNGKTNVTIYVYPSGAAYDTRFLQEYRRCIESIIISERVLVTPIPKHLYYKKDGYTINGFRADYFANGHKSVLELYECGDWFFKIRTTSDILDTSVLHDIDNRFTDYFNPTNLIQHSTLTSKSAVHVAPGAVQDSAMLYCTLGSLFKKLEWFNTNIDSMERLAGVPNQYLEAQMIEYESFANYSDSAKGKLKRSHDIEFVRDIKKLMYVGYLDEFLMEGNNEMLICPTNWNFDYRGYDKWRESNDIGIKLNVTNYVIRYIQKDEPRDTED